MDDPVLDSRKIKKPLYFDGHFKFCSESDLVRYSYHPATDSLDKSEADFKQSNIVDYFFTLLYDEDANVRTAAATVLSNLTGDAALRDIVWKNNGLKIILFLLDSNDEECVRAAVRIAGNLCSEGRLLSIY